MRTKSLQSYVKFVIIFYSDAFKYRFRKIETSFKYTGEECKLCKWKLLMYLIFTALFVHSFDLNKILNVTIFSRTNISNIHN